MSEKKEHPVPLALSFFENILQGCVSMAKTGALDTLEEMLLERITAQVLELHEQFSDRALMEAMEANACPQEFEELTATKARVKERLLKQAARSDQPELQEIALEMIPTTDLTEC